MNQGYELTGGGGRGGTMFESKVSCEIPDTSRLFSLSDTIKGKLENHIFNI